MLTLALMLRVATAAALAASVAALGGRFGWLFELTTHFRLQYGVALVLLLVPLALTRQRAWLAAALAGLALNAAALGGYWPVPLAAAAVPDSGIKVMTANLLYRGRTPGTRFIEIVRAAKPDVLLVTEYTPRWAEALAGLDRDYPHALKLPRGDAYGVALLSRYPLEAAAPLELATSTAVEARIRTPQRRSFTLLGVHLRSPAAPRGATERNHELKLLTAHRATIEGPVVITGDFNITPFSPLFQDWLAGTGVRDARRGFGYAMSWPAFLPILGIPIDHCLVSDEFIVLAHRRLPAFGSDHYPILAEVALR